MRELKNKLTTGKSTKNIQSKKAKSFGYQILGFGSGGGLPVTSLVANMMIIGGGGGSFIAPSPGGGGAGGMVFIPASDMTPHFTTVVGDLDITIGAGGTGQRSFDAAGKLSVTPGGNTTLVDQGGNAFTAFNGIGGGAGGTSGSVGSTLNPSYSIPGGSGGGGIGESGSPGATNPGGSSTQAPGMPSPLQPFGFGNAGGNGTSCDASPDRHGGGGGGAGGAGNPSGGTANGGNGKSVTPLFGSAPQPYYIANGSNAGASACGVFGGGGGGAQDPQRASGGGGSSGGPGGGGNAPDSPNTTGDGIANTGGGGGAGRDPNPPQSRNYLTLGGNGGSGYVLIKVPSCHSGAFAASPGCNTVTTQPDGTKIAAFKVSGTLDLT